MSNCTNYNIVHPVTGLEVESNLHKKLKKDYPETVVDGVSSYYLYILENEDFINNFGKVDNKSLNWTIEEDYKELIKLSKNSGVFNMQGEPQLHIDFTGPYILSINGTPLYLNDNNVKLTSDDYSSGANTFAGKFIYDNLNKDLNTFIKDELNKRIKELEFKNNELDELIEIEDDEDLIDSYYDSQTSNDAKIEKLKAILDTPTIFNAFLKRTQARIEKSNFKVKETIGDKEDDSNMDSHEDVVNYVLEVNETSNRAMHDPQILKFFSSIPQFENFKTNVNNQNPKINKLFGGRLFMDQSSALGLVESILSNNLVVKENENSFDNYLNILKNEVEKTEHAELNYIYDYLKNINRNVKNPKEFKIKFYSAMNKSSQNYVMTLVEKNKDKINLGIIDPANTSNKVGKIANNFIETIINIQDRKREDISKIKANAKNEFKKIKNSNSENEYINFLNKLLVKDLKLKLDKRTISFLVKNESSFSFSQLNSLINTLLDSKIDDSNLTSSNGDPLTGELDVLKELFDSRGSESILLKEYLMRPDTEYSRHFFKALASYEAIYENKNSEATVFVGNKQRWLYSFVSNLQLELERIKQGESSRLSNLSNKGLKFVNWMIENKDHLQNVTIYSNTELKALNDSNPVLHKQITEVDLHLDIFHKMFNSKKDFYEEFFSKKQGVKELKELNLLNNYLTYNFGADKNSLFSIFGLPRPDSNMSDLYNINKKTIGKSFKDLLDNYVEGELIRAMEASELVETYLNLPDKDKLKFMMENLIPDYHYRLDKKENKNLEVERLSLADFKRGSYHKIGIFTSSLEKYLQNTDNNILIYGKNNLVPLVQGEFIKGKQFSDSAFNELMGIVYDDINNIIKKNYDALNKMTLINTENENGDFVNKKLFDVTTNIDFGGNKDLAINSYIISSFITGYELSNIFNGHISFYKQKNNTDQNLDDFLKRGSAPGTSGFYMYTDKTDKSTKNYKTFDGEIKTVRANTNTIVAIVESINVNKSKYADIISKTRGGEKLLYDHEVADAQGFITSEHFKEIIERTYSWSDLDERMYNELSDRNHIVSLENINWIKEYSKSFTPLKLTHFEVNDNDIPVYLKYSVAPLFPALVNGTEAEKIRNQMIEQGVEQIVFKSGSKGSNLTTTKIHTDKNGEFTGIRDDLKFNPFTINSEMTKIQTQVPTKLNTSIALGNQVLKNILVNLDFNNKEKNYFFNGEYLNSEEIYNEIDKTLKNILQSQLNNTLNELGYDKQELKFNKVNIKKFLIGQMDIESEIDIINLLKTNLPLETIPNFTQRAFPVISKFIHKNAGKVYTNGGSVVQVANTGFDRVTDKTKKGIFFFDNNKRELTPPIPIKYKDLSRQEKNLIEASDEDIIYWNEQGEMSTNPKEGKMRIAKARILLPFTNLFKNAELSYEDFIDMYNSGKIDKEIFQKVIGYRIPNQAIASIDSFEIVGILPPIAGDQAIVYNEITAKTGSDFDIDKMYLMLPTFRTNSTWAVPEENQAMIDELKEEKAYLPISEFEQLSFLHYKSGNEIVDVFKKDLFFKRKYNELRPDSINKHVDGPIKTILDNYDEFIDLLSINNETIKDNDGSILPLKSILEDLYQAFRKRKEAVDEFNKDKKEKIRDIRKKYGYNKASEIRYVNPNEERQDSYKNRLIELYTSVLESKATYDDLMSPLDNEIIKDTINEVLYIKANPDDLNPSKETVDSWVSENKIKGLEQMFPVNLVNSRVSVLEAKQLISIMANNMTDLGESQKTNFKLKHDIGFGITELSRIYQLQKDGDNEAKISKIVSYGMNAAVDAAKDDYIISGNFTTYTANTGMMLMRLGINLKDIFTILTNDTILEYSKEKTNAKAKTANINVEYNTNQLDDFAKTIVSKLQNTKNNSIFDIISKEDFIKNNPDKKELILGFWHLLQEVSKEFNNAVVAMKSDSNGPGKNLAQMIALDNRISRMMEDGISGSDTKWFKNGLNYKNRKFDPNIINNPDAKFLGVMANNTLFLMKEVSEQLFLEATPKVIRTVNSMSAILGEPLPTEEGHIKLLYNYLYPYLLYKTEHPLYKISEQEEEYLLNRFPRELQRKKLQYNNAFLNELIVTSREDYNLIKFLNSENYPIEEQLKLKESIIDLMNLDNKFLTNIVKYSYLTTGFKFTPFSFHQFLPANFFINNFHGKFVQNFIEKENDIIDPSQALLLIAKNNHQNYKLVKEKRKGDGLLLSNTPVTNQKLLDKIEIINASDEKAYFPFIKNKNKLFKLIDIENGFPVYDEYKDINRIPDFKIYNYYTDPETLHVSDIYYKSKSSILFNEDNLNTEDYKEALNMKLEEVDKIKFDNGKTPRDLGLSQEEWDSMTEEEKQNKYDCNK